MYDLWSEEMLKQVNNLKFFEMLSEEKVERTIIVYCRNIGLHFPECPPPTNHILKFHNQCLDVIKFIQGKGYNEI